MKDVFGNEVRFATADEGHYHWYICNQCGECNGGWLHYPDRQLPTEPRGNCCPFCSSTNLRLSTCEESLAAEPPSEGAS